MYPQQTLYFGKDVLIPQLFISWSIQVKQIFSNFLCEIEFFEIDKYQSYSKSNTTERIYNGKRDLVSLKYIFHYFIHPIDKIFHNLSYSFGCVILLQFEYLSQKKNNWFNAIKKNFFIMCVRQTISPAPCALRGQKEKSCRAVGKINRQKSVQNLAC